MNCLKSAEIIIRSSCNTRNSNYVVAVTPEIATTHLLQHQQQQLSKEGTTLFCNNWNTGNDKQQLSEDRKSSMLTQHDQQLSRKCKTWLQLLKHQEQHEFTKSATMRKRQRIVRGFQEDG